MSAHGTKRTIRNVGVMSAIDQSGRFSVLAMDWAEFLAVGSSISMPDTVRRTARQKIAVLIDYHDHGLGVLPE